jgi:1-phosphatidylinositol-4-phosphate 5-kinase
MMICAPTIIEELFSTGQSGSLFYFTRDGKFIVKTLPEKEYLFLKKIFPSYYKHIMLNKDTLLPK